MFAVITARWCRPFVSHVLTYVARIGAFWCCRSACVTLTSLVWSGWCRRANICPQIISMLGMERAGGHFSSFQPGFSHPKGSDCNYKPDTTCRESLILLDHCVPKGFTLCSDKDPFDFNGASFKCCLAVLKSMGSFLRQGSWIRL